MCSMGPESLDFEFQLKEPRPWQFIVSGDPIDIRAILIHEQSETKTRECE